MKTTESKNSESADPIAAKPFRPTIVRIAKGQPPAAAETTQYPKRFA